MKKRALSMVLALVMLLSLVPASVWAEPATETVSSAEKFADMDENGSYRLTKDIVVTAPYEKDFSGTFDGNGHTVTLNIPGSDSNVALFKTVAGGTVKNVATTGSVSGNECVAAIAASMTGGSITGCANTAEISATSRYVGGIVGKMNGGTVENCYNKAVVSTTRTRPVFLGGIVGNLNSSTATVKNCYNSGAINTTGKNAASIVGWVTSGTVENCYYLEGTHTAGMNSSSGEDLTVKKTDAEMKASDFAKLLGDAFMVKAGDYPALTWETPTAKVAFTLSPENAVLTIGGNTYTGSCEVALAAGSYDYTVSCGGYTSKTGSVTVVDENGTLTATPDTVSVTLEEDASAWSRVTFDVTPASASLKVLDGEAEMLPAGDGSYKLLKNHAYTYTASTTEEGYEAATGSVTPANDTEQVHVTLRQVTAVAVKTSPTKTEYYKGDAALDTTGLTITVAYSDGSTKDLTEGFTVSGFDTSEAVEAQAITVTYLGKSTEFTVKILEKPIFADFFKDIKDSIQAADDATYPFAVVQDDAGNYLQSSNTANGSESTITLTAKKNVSLRFDYLGSNSSSSYYCFTVKNGSNPLLSAYNKTSWETFSADVKAGDTLTLTFEHPYVYGSSDYCVKLKNFQVSPLYTLTMEAEPKDAALTVKDSAGKVLTGENGVYTVTPGTYTYSASRFGYSSQEGSVTVTDADVTQPVHLTKLDSYPVRFGITLPEGVTEASTVTVKSGSQTVYAGDGTDCTLPDGKYTYTVTNPRCDDAVGSFEVKGGQAEVSVTLTRKPVFEDFFDGMAGVTAANGTGYGFAPAQKSGEAVLASTNQGKNSSTAEMTLTLTQNAMLHFAYRVSSEANYDKFILKLDGGAPLVTESGDGQWKEYSVTASAGSKVTFQYSKDSSGNRNDDTLYLKNFAVVPVYTLTLEVKGAADADVTVTNEAGETVTGENGAYLVPAGTYKYTVSKFGYATQSGSVEIKDKDVPKTVTLSALESFEVAFDTDPADAAVTLTHAAAGTIAAKDGKYTVYSGETYRYTVEKNGYVTVSGSLVAAKNDTITVKLENAGAPWDGSSKTQPQKDGDVYLISNASELAWFADTVNGGQTTLQGRLTANINLGGKTWTSFGEYASGDSTKGFAGTLDGGYFTVSGLTGTGGLVECVAAAGTVKNLRVDADISTSSGVIGGIANNNYGTIENCLVSGSVTGNTGTYSSNGTIGGIVGRSMTDSIIRGCVNLAAVKNAYQNYADSSAVGGIVGYTYGLVESCYSMGAVSSTAKTASSPGVGGLIGKVNTGAEVKGCYAAGTVTGPENGIGAFAGSNTASITNCYYLAAKAPGVAQNTASAPIALEQRTTGEMQDDLFAYQVGMLCDTGRNGGFPVLAWQGGRTPDVPSHQQDIAADRDALTLKDAARAEALAAQKEQVRQEADTFIDEILADPNLGEDMLIELFGSTDRAVIYQAFYDEYGVDPDDDGTLTPDSQNAYQIKDAGRLALAAEGEHGSAITWVSSSPLVNAETGEMTLPESGKETVTLTATIRKGNYKTERSFTLVLWSQAAQTMEVLEGMKAMLEKNSTVLQPLQVYGHTNITQALTRLLVEQGYDDSVADAVQVQLLDAGKRNGSNDSIQYIAEDGSITYYTGALGNSTNTVQYLGLKFRLTLEGQSVEVTTRACVGWDVEYVTNLLQQAADSMNWDTIRDKNENTAAEQTVNGWNHVVVDGEVSRNLLLPYRLANNPAVSVAWGSRDGNILSVSDNNDGTYTAELNRPLMGQEAKAVTLIAMVTFNFFDDYTAQEYTGRDGTASVQAQRFFDFSIAPSDVDVSGEITEALEKYPTLIRDFVDKSAVPDLSAVTADLQMPRPSVLEDNGIMTDSWVQRVKMVSNTPDVLAFNGYHAMVYRPLPGEQPAEASYTITITQDGAILGQKTFTLTVAPFTEEELQQAEAFMHLAMSDEVYWNGIRGKNTEKNSVSSDLNYFVEILDKGNGQVEYVRGMDGITFAGIEADDIPGWYDTQQYRSFKSSRPSVIEHELLRVSQPEYDTQVTIESVLTYTKLAQYWEKFGLAEDSTEESRARYARFEQFYKQPVSATVTVLGEKGPAPTSPEDISVSLSISGKGWDSFKDCTGYTFTGSPDQDWTAWDVLQACLNANGYSYVGSGSYVSALTDPNGVTLGELAHGEMSGWLFTVNGVMVDTVLSGTYVHSGDVIEFYYSAAGMPDQPTDPTEPGGVPEALEKIYELTKEHMEQTVTDPEVGNIGGEWAIFAMARSGVELPEELVNSYYAKVVQYVREHLDEQGRLDRSRSTDNSRLILALTALGIDPRDVDGHDLLQGLSNMSYVKKQGTNGLIYALLAFDSGKYDTPANGDVTREALIQEILARQNEDGSFYLGGVRKTASVDVTAMALQALAPYYQENSQVKDAVDRALAWLSGQQSENGGFASDGSFNAESSAQVVTALAALGIDAARDKRFVKSGGSVLDALLRYHQGEGVFMHTANDGADQMATEQALYAMAAYVRQQTGRNRLYDMTDAARRTPVTPIQPVQPATPGQGSVQTGDGESPVLWLGMSVVCLLGAAAVLRRKKETQK